MERQKHAQKVMVLGVDGLDPKYTKWYMDQGGMQNLKKIYERGTGREDMVLLGGHPTITPPMWTTLATVVMQMFIALRVFTDNIQMIWKR